jgi:hypothetical protein
LIWWSIWLTVVWAGELAIASCACGYAQLTRFFFFFVFQGWWAALALA